MLIEILNPFFARLIACHVDVNIRHHRSLFRKESLKEQLLAHRIDDGDFERVAHDATGGRAAPLRHDAVRFAKLHEIPKR